MKLNVIVGRDGVIVGTAPATPKAEGEDAPVSIRLVPGAGRTLLKLDVPKEAIALSAAELGRRYRVSLRGQPKIVRVREQRATPAPPSPTTGAAKKRP